MGSRNNRTTNNLSGIGTGVQRKRQQGRVKRLPENLPPECFLNTGNLSNTIVDNIKLNQQRGATENIGVKPNRARHKWIFNRAKNRQRNRKRKPYNQTQKHQLNDRNTYVPVFHDCHGGKNLVPVKPGSDKIGWHYQLS